MTVRALVLVCGALMAAAAVAAEEQSTLSGGKITVNNVTGAIECSGGCVVRFTQPVNYSAKSTTVQGDLPSGFHVSNVVLSANAMQYVVEGVAEMRTTQGAFELKAEKIRMIKAPATL